MIYSEDFNNKIKTWDYGPEHAMPCPAYYRLMTNPNLHITMQIIYDTNQSTSLKIATIFSSWKP